jgi:hypothetical protein
VVGRIESDDDPRPRDDTVNKLDGPLRWEPGSAQRVLAGGDPRAIDRPSLLQEISIDALLAEIRRRFEAFQSISPGRRVAGPVIAEDESEKFPWGRDVGGVDPGEAAGEGRQQHGQ